MEIDSAELLDEKEYIIRATKNKQFIERSGGAIR
jgi:hypothetical protein